MRRTNVRQPCTPCRTQARSDDAVAAYELGGNSPGILNIRRPPYTALKSGVSMAQQVLGDVQELARQKSREAITTLANIMHDEKAPPAARVAAANALLDRGYGKPTQPISQTLAKIDPSSISDEEFAAIAMNGASVNAQAH